MAEIELELGDWRQLQRRIQQFTLQQQQVIIRSAAEVAGAKFDEIVRSELPPPRRPLRQSHKWTARQRRWWWATMHAKARGESKDLPGWKAAYRKVDGRKRLVISGFYKRTGKLVQSLNYEVRQAWPVTDVVYGTNREYAPFVIDEDRQAEYHRGNWKTLQQFLRDNQQKVLSAFEHAVEREIQRLLGE